jgi:hypothetical protein
LVENELHDLAIDPSAVADIKPATPLGSGFYYSQDYYQPGTPLEFFENRL